MPIYSRDSIGSGLKVVANENYSYADMGRILSECVQNDMTLFNAVLKNDFQENAAIREGTMVASELTAFREFSAREAWRSLKEKLQKLWEKIKGVFRQVYSKLTVWLVRNGKAFVAMNRKILANKTGLGDCEIPKYLKRTGLDIASIPTKLGEQARNFIKLEKVNSYSGDGNMTVDKELNRMLAGTLKGASDVTADNYAEKFKEAAFTELTNFKYSTIQSELPVETLFANITSKSKAIRDLKKAEREVDKALKNAISSIESARKKIEDDKAQKDQANTYKDASTKCSAFERAITITTRCTINAIKTGVAQDRQLVGKLVAYSPKKESALMQEMAWLEGADDFATMEDIPAEDVNDPDVAGDPDVQVNIEVEDDGE